MCSDRALTKPFCMSMTMSTSRNESMLIIVAIPENHLTPGDRCHSCLAFVDDALGYAAPDT